MGHKISNSIKLWSNIGACYGIQIHLKFGTLKVLGYTQKLPPEQISFSKKRVFRYALMCKEGIKTQFVINQT